MPITNPSAMAMIPTDRAMMALSLQFLGEWAVDGSMDSMVRVVMIEDQFQVSASPEPTADSSSSLDHPMVSLPRSLDPSVEGLGCILPLYNFS